MTDNTVYREAGIAAAEDYLASKQSPQRNRRSFLAGFPWIGFAIAVVVAIAASVGVMV